MDQILEGLANFKANITDFFHPVNSFNKPVINFNGPVSFFGKILDDTNDLTNLFTSDDKTQKQLN